MAEGEEGEEEGKTTLFRLQLTPRKDFTSKISLGVKISFMIVQHFNKKISTKN